VVVLDDWADPERKMTVKKGAVVFLKHSLGFQKDPPGDSIGFFDVSGIFGMDSRFGSGNLSTIVLGLLGTDLGFVQG